ncbi:MAG: sulfotransferase [Gammaproteobacteria bacterium]|nr:sulfotransferase [Gammaproteobacteria bacterium]MDH5729822.1 sulfotransferase [Gammaproteobacteria bacterium]
MFNRKLEYVFVTGCARSGTTLLFDLISSSPSLWSTYQEIHGIYEWDIGLHPDYEKDNGNVLLNEDMKEERRESILEFYNREIYNTERYGLQHLNCHSRLDFIKYHLFKRYSKTIDYFSKASRKVIDKNPKHVYRTDFLKVLDPNAKFIFIIRDGFSNISSLIEGWETGSFKTYRIPVESGQYVQWSFELPPGWHNKLMSSIAERAAFQWTSANEMVIKAMNDYPNDSICIRYEDMIRAPEIEISKICGFIGVDLHKYIANQLQELPVVNALSKPSEDKWHSRRQLIETVYPMFSGLQEELGYGSL